MKRLIIIIISLLILMTSLSVYGQDIVTANQVTVAWDPVAPIQPDDIIAYQLFRADYPITGDRQDASLYEDLGVLTNTDQVITFTVEGDFVIGVRTIRGIQGFTEPVYSEINWSDVNGASTPVPFVIRYVISPAVPEGLRLQ